MRLMIHNLSVLVFAWSVACAEEKKGTPRTAEEETSSPQTEIRLNPQSTRTTVQIGTKVYCGSHGRPHPRLRNGLGFEFIGLKVQVNGNKVQPGRIVGVDDPGPTDLVYYLFEPTQKGMYEITITSHGIECIGDRDHPKDFETTTYYVNVK